MKHIRHLKKDKILEPVIRKHGPVELSTNRNVFWYLCSSIISQQLSVSAARTIKSRFLNLNENKIPLPEELLRIETEMMRQAGLSEAKSCYLKNVASFAIDKGLTYGKLNKMENEEVIEYLTEIKGVGRWTVEMVLMFSLGREDVFPVDDGGIIAAMKNLYGISSPDKKKRITQMQKIAENWVPYRSYACMYLWKFKDGKV
ncbi:MAG: DNA-3-methyladenine glycosylase 2 family protein [Bacteroidia bacterium]|nr:DNA-3-methyladenine glycosylase 2 family protein [Bacteroidia bacterium]